MNLKKILGIGTLMLPLVATNVEARDEVYHVNGLIFPVKSFTSKEGAEFPGGRFGNPRDIELIADTISDICKNPNTTFSSGKFIGSMYIPGSIMQFSGNLGRQTWHVLKSNSKPNHVAIGMPFSFQGYDGIVLDILNGPTFSGLGYGDSYDQIIPDVNLNNRTNFADYFNIKDEAANIFGLIHYIQRREIPVFFGRQKFTPQELKQIYQMEVDAAREFLDQGYTFQCF